MPGPARMYIAGLTCHVVRRGNNREACFIEPDNYQVFYLGSGRNAPVIMG